MKLVDKTYFHNIEVKRSKFIAHIVPFQKFEEYRERLRAENPKASHIVYAYRRLNNGIIDEAFSDDGEPKGCAGMPLLKVLRGWEIIESAVLIVRYFGGIKLGTGGMVRAYTQAAQELLQCTPLIDYIPKECIVIDTPYDEIRKIEYICKTNDIDIVSRYFGEKIVEWKLRGERESLEKLQKYIIQTPL